MTPIHRRAFLVPSHPIYDSSSPPLPWFVDPSTLPSTPSPSSPKKRIPITPSPPPSHIPQLLHGLHAHLSISPFLNRDAITYIDAQAADPDNSWTEWVIICTLKRGREGGIRGAIEGVRSYVRPPPPPLSSLLTDEDEIGSWLNHQLILLHLLLLTLSHLLLLDLSSRDYRLLHRNIREGGLLVRVELNKRVGGQCWMRVVSSYML